MQKNSEKVFNHDPGAWDFRLSETTSEYSESLDQTCQIRLLQRKNK